MVSWHTRVTCEFSWGRKVRGLGIHSLQKKKVRSIYNTLWHDHCKIRWRYYITQSTSIHGEPKEILSHMKVRNYHDSDPLTCLLESMMLFHSSPKQNSATEDDWVRVLGVRNSLHTIPYHRHHTSINFIISMVTYYWCSIDNTANTGQQRHAQRTQGNDPTFNSKLYSICTGILRTRSLILRACMLGTVTNEYGMRHKLFLAPGIV